MESTSFVTRENVDTLVAADTLTSHVESSPPETPTRVSASMEHEANNRVSEPSDQLGKLDISVSRTVFKPVSSYQLKRDKKRLDSFKTRKNSPKNNQRMTRSKANISDAQQSDIEQVRGLDSDLESTMAISPEKPDVELMISSPFADKNPYSLLEVDADTPSPPQGPSTESTDMCYESSADVAESTIDESSEEDGCEEESHEAYLVRTWQPPPGMDPESFNTSHLAVRDARML